ncbi:unnamed protein product [Euphydryas editha]|uniref:Uncharacterized protein n=1 Tax=Euphydryas editha TaxID=104508 RepID=A0AAU9U3Y2_EUPED|nr:unnamed protein product [Euphydryas editha]
MWVVLLVYLHVVIGVDVKLIPSEKNISVSNIAACVHEIYDLHQNSYKLTIITYTDEPKENISDNLLTKKIPYVITYNVNDLTKISDLNEGTVLIVINIKYCIEITDLEIKSFYIKFRYIIIVDIYVPETCYEDMKKILYELKNYNVIIITRDRKTNNYNLITVIPEIDEVTCAVSERLTINLINVCRNGLLDKKAVSDIFPSKKINNFKMCNLNIGMSEFYPYSIVNNKDSLKDLDRSKHMYGADVETMKILAKKFNSKLKLFYIQINKTTSDNVPQFIQDLIDGKLEACAGGLYRRYGDVVAYSGIYTKQSIFWVYTVERDRRSWQSLVGKMTGLYVFLITYVCYVILWNVLSQFDYQTMTIIDSFVYGWGALVGASGLQNARSLKQKILNIVYLIVCLHLSAFVSTQIFYYLTIDRPPKQFKTTEEIRASNRTSYLIPAEKYFVDDKKYIAHVNKSRDCFTFTQCEELMLKHKASTILIEGLFSRFQSVSSVGDEASVMRVAEDILVSYHEIILRKNSTLVETVQKSVQRLFEAGICQKLYIEAIGILIVDKAKIANKNILSNSYSCTLGCEITLSQSAVAFYVWILGCCFSCFIFFFEILIKAPTISFNDT